MQIAAVLVIAILTFGVCYLFDKGYVALFRNKVQHRSGLAVRVNKRYAVFGLLLGFLGLIAIFNSAGADTVLLVGGIVVLVLGIGLIVYYMSFGIFYDEDSLLITAFGKKSSEYRFSQIKGQKLYLIQGGSVVVELHMDDGRTVSVQSGMEGAYPFLDHAFSAWCRQKGIDPTGCGFHDLSQSLWFPTVEDV